MNILTEAVLRELTLSARARDRRRDNLNIHSAHNDPIQRLVIALEPGSYVRPHRHRTDPKWELMTRLSGLAVLLTFDDSGTVRDRVVMDSKSPIVEIPADTWHTLLAIEPGTLILEVKPGPYSPLPPGDFAPWAPAEGSPDAPAIVGWIQEAGVGDRFDRL